MRKVVRPQQAVYIVFMVCHPMVVKQIDKNVLFSEFSVSESKEENSSLLTSSKRIRKK